MDSTTKSKFRDEVNKRLKEIEKEERESLREFHDIFFKDFDLNNFEKNVMGLDYSKGKKFINACRFLKESKEIETECDKCGVVKDILLFISIETLIGECPYYTFNQWLTKNKKAKGKDERDKKSLRENLSTNKYQVTSSFLMVATYSFIINLINFHQLVSFPCERIIR